ncbi:MAG: 2-C-methyl-D-erythritol 4-phosphate cytidylyltransferase [Verrucomicrobiota bacterium]|jgi:2-C-methyl-D-erythritol 4-phosphate cytidylyltransferase|nr:MAG: 2-C-methyl-D-erythritol 4-phosphate cytidylyltransferase [Verrucomicrobiota bacterium]
MSRTAVILLAAGSGKRMQGSVEDKVLAPLAGNPLFAHSAKAFLKSGVADLYVVVYRDQRQMLELSAYAPTPSLLVRGGKERQDSVMNALSVLPADIDYVFIHDCARPLIEPETIKQLHAVVRKYNAVVLAHRVTDTIKEKQISKGSKLARLKTIDRSRLWAMETPQVFSKALIVKGYSKIASQKKIVTDDTAAVDAIGHPIALLENQYPNPKLTHPSDLAYLEFLLSAR